MVSPAVSHFSGRDGVRLAFRELGDGRPLVLPRGTLAVLPGNHATAPAAPEFVAAFVDFLADRG